MSSLGAAGGPGSPIRSSQPLTIPEDEEVQDPDVATLLSDLFSGDWGAEPTPAASAPQSSAGQDKQQGGNSRPLQAAQDAGGGSFVLRSDAPAPLPPGDARQPREEPFPGFRMSPPGVGDFQTRGAPAIKKKPGILSSLTAGPAFLQKQLRKAQAGAGGSPSPPKGEAPKPGGGRQKLPLKHAVTEPTSKLLDFLRDARAGGADVPEPLIQQISSMEPQQEEQAELFLPASAAHNSVPFYRRRGFWVSNLLLLLWSLTFVGAGLGLLLESQDCPTGCPGPKNTARLLPPLDPECACWGTPSLEQCGFNSPDACSSACGCVSLQDPCWADGCDAGKIGNDSIPWRVMFFLACIPVAAWASQILGWLFVSLISGIEAWAERKEQRQQQREAAARLQQELELELRKRQQLEGEKQRALARMATLGSGKLGGSGSGQLGGGSGSGELPAAPVGPVTAPKTGPARPQIGSVVSWQAGLLERAAASAKLAGDVPAPLEHASILPPAPQNPAGGAAAALLDGASGMSEVVAAKTQEAPKAVEVSERSLASGLARFLLGLEASYLAEHIRPQIQRCVFMGLATGFWAIFWSISYNNVVPDHNSRFWVFFRVLLCLTLMLVVNLITCFVSSLAGIKLKRMNHRARMLEVSKREALLQLLLSKGLEDEDDPRAANKLLPPELQPPEAREAPEGNGPTAPRQSLSWRSRGKLLGFGNTLLPLARLSQAVSTTFGSEKRSSSLPNNKGENGDIEQARDGGQGGEALRRSATDTGARRWGGRGLDRSRSGSGHSVEPPPSPLTSPKSSGSLGLANGAGDSGLPSPSAGSATSGAAPPAPNGPAAAAGAPPVAERQRVALTSRAGDLSKAHMLADRERHFLEDELRLKYWNARAEALPGPGGVPLTGREDSTVVSSEEDAASLGRFVFHRRLLAFVKLRAQLIKEAKGRQEAEQAKAAAERASKAREEAAAKAAKAAEAGGTGEGGAGAAFVRDLSMRAVAESIPGLLDMFGSSTEDEEGVAASASAPPPAQGPAAGGPVWAPPLAAAAPGPGRPMARTASGTPARTPLQGPFAGSPRGEATRKQLFAAGGGSAGPAAPAVPGEATPGGALTARSYASRSSAGRREGLDKDMLRHFLEARGAGSETDYAFDVLDRDYDDFITEENVVRMVRQLYKDRLNLRKGLEGTNTILRKLDVFIGAVLHAIFIIFYLLVWGVAFNDSFYNAFSALLLAFSFIFQSTITNLYENVVFIFVIHPYDVGDMLLLSCTSCGSSSRHEVEEIHLNYTRFLDKENGRVWWPNRTLRDTAFINLTTSEIMEDNFHLLLDLDVAARHPDLLRKIKARLDDYCRKHRGEFDTTGTSVTYRDIMSPMGVLMKAEWRYSHPGTSKERCAKARTGLLIFAAQVLTELGVRYSWPNPFRPGDAPSCHGLGGHAGTAPGPGGSRHVGRSMSSESLPAQMRGPSAGAAPGRPGSQQQQQLRGGSVGPLGGSGPSGPQHTRSGSGLQSLADPLQQPVGAPGGEGGPARVRRTESSETVAADVPLHRLASMGEASGLAGSPSFSRGSMDGQAGLPPSGPPRSRAGGAEAAGRGSALAPAGRLSGATLAPTAAGRGARAALVLGNTIEEPGQHPEQLRLLPEAQIP